MTLLMATSLGCETKDKKAGIFDIKIATEPPKQIAPISIIINF